jgi:hypothetical protein
MKVPSDGELRAFIHQSYRLLYAFLFSIIQELLLTLKGKSHNFGVPNNFQIFSISSSSCGLALTKDMQGKGNSYYSSSFFLFILFRSTG